MSFKCYVIEVREILWQLLTILTLLYNVLLFIPMPWTVYLTKIFNDKRIAVYAFLAIAEYSNTLSVHLKMNSILLREVLDCIKQDTSYLLVLLIVFAGQNRVHQVDVNNEFECQLNVIPLFTLLLNCVG